MARTLLCLTLVLCAVSLALGQTAAPQSQVKGDHSKQKLSFMLAGRTVSNPFNPISKTRFAAGSDVYVEVLVTNCSAAVQPIVLGSPWTEFSLELLKAGEVVVPLRESMKEFLTASPDKPFSRSLAAFSLDPDESSREVLNLTDWFEPLAPGHYQLTVARIWTQAFTAKPIAFEVTAEE